MSEPRNGGWREVFIETFLKERGRGHSIAEALVQARAAVKASSPKQSVASGETGSAGE